MYRFEIFPGGVLRRKWFFRFKSPNGRVMMQSQGYADEDNAEDAIETLQREATGAEIVKVGE